MNEKEKDRIREEVDKLMSRLMKKDDPNQWFLIAEVLDEASDVIKSGLALVAIKNSLGISGEEMATYLNDDSPKIKQ